MPVPSLKFYEIFEEKKIEILKNFEILKFFDNFEILKFFAIFEFLIT
jgi:hypothetical protein